MSLNSLRRTAHDFLPGFLMIAIAELIEIGYAALTVIVLAAIVSMF